MLNLVILALMAAAFLSLAAAVVFLYRFMARKRLFPQLPRLWKSDRLRFIISLACFVVLGAAFAAFSVMAPAPAGGEAALEAEKPGDAPLGPSFDGQPPPTMPVKTKPARAAGEERVLPPSDRAAKAAPQADATGRPGLNQQPTAPGAAPDATPAPEPTSAPQTAPAPQAPARPPHQAQPRADSQAPPAAPPSPGKPQAKAAPGEVYVEQPVQPEPKAQPKQAPPQKPAAPKTAQAPVQPPAEPAPKAQPRPEPKPAPKAEPAPKPAPKAETTAQPKPKSAAKTEPRKTGVRPKKAYTVCAASFRQKNDASREAKKLMAKGFKPQVITVNLGKKGRWYRICLGDFPTPAMAQARLKALTASGLGGTPFVTRLR